MAIPFKFGKNNVFSEKKIGQIFFDGETALICVESGYCEHNEEDCHFWGTGDTCDNLKCTSDKRSDYKSVCFIKHK